MKITVEVTDCQQFGLSPTYIYKTLCNEYWGEKSRESGLPLWGMATVCNTAARELYARIKGRRSNVTNLILTYSDAEACSDLFKQFADVWVSNSLDVKDERKKT